MSTRDELAGVLADTINKQFKDMKVAYFLDGTDSTPTDIKDFVSTGSTMLEDQGGGPRGYVDSMGTLICRGPKGLGKIGEIA